MLSCYKANTFCLRKHKLNLQENVHVVIVIILLILLQDDVCIETEEGLTHCKLIAVHAGLETKNNVEEQLKLLRDKDTSIPRIQPLTGRKTVWGIPQVKKTLKEPNFVLRSCSLLKSLCMTLFALEHTLQELDDKKTIVVSGHHGKLHIDGLRLIIDEGGGYTDTPLAAIVLPSKKIIRDTDNFSN